MRNFLFSIPLAIISLVIAPVAMPIGGTALAQPVTAPPDAQDDRVQPALRTPDLPEGSKPSEYLRAAAGALATGHYGETEEALEMAQTRMLDRSVPLFQTNNPSDNPVTQQINQARQALAAHDRETCMRFIQDAIASATAQGF
ncbi:MAG: hypothetical protein B7Z80_06015 [Rhodospirillales bacterium 20-64-7]|nr:MAG: hypothetical protein B7Z80_06015 [Rhodospirillales bacterium 20-64-7]HQT77226.1 hypothetical protein [Rhodopila sp.]